MAWRDIAGTDRLPLAAQVRQDGRSEIARAHVIDAPQHGPVA